MASCPTCSARLRPQYIGSEFACPACGDRLRANPYAAGLLALLLGGIPSVVMLVLEDDSWEWIAGGFFASILATYALWRILFKIEPHPELSIARRDPHKSGGVTAVSLEKVMTDSPARRTAPTPWHLWAIGIIALLWNAMGAMDYVMKQTRNEAYLGGFTAEQLEFFHSFPTWVVAAWAVGVWGGVLGALLLLFRKQLAVWVCLASLLAIVVTTFHNYVLSKGMTVVGDAFSLAFTAVIFLFALGLYLYARAMHGRGVLA